VLRRRENGERVRLIFCLGAAGAVFVAGVALAATQTIEGRSDNTFSAATYTTDQGEVAPLQVTGGTHNATASGNGPDGKPLFRSATISGGTTPVNGTQYLTSGSYPFICTIHPSTMQATLVVTGNGTPQARPHMDLKLVSSKLAKVVKKGKLRVGINASVRSDDVSVEAKLGKASLGRAQNLSLPAGPSSAVLKLTKAGKSKLAGRDKATILLNGSVAFGAPSSAKGKLK
jgi:plastocyanin